MLPAYAVVAGFTDGVRIMEALIDRLIPIAALLIIIASQLFWLRRLIEIGERFIPGKRGRTVLKFIVIGTCLLFFGGVMVPWHSTSENGTHAPTTLTLRSILFVAPLSWWLVGSLTGLLLIMIFTTVDRAVRAAVWLYRKARDAAAVQTATSATGAIALDPPSPGRRRFLEQTAIALSATPFVASAYGLLYGRLDMEITRRRIILTRLPKAFEGFRIALLSDVHISPFMTGDQVQRYVKITNELKADLIALTGDFLADDPEAQGEVVHILGSLRAPYGVFGCLGNHEFMTETEESITRLFASEQIRILRQERVPVQSHGETMNLIGIDYQQARFSSDHDGHLVDRYMEGNEKLVQPEMVNILLSHNPNAFDRAAELGIDLMLSGHLHGGQMSLAFLYRGLSLARFETPYVSGWYEKSGSQLYVNRGIGTTGFPIRFGARPEITVLELVRGT
ncbi:MAG TPA: metallophosphoesterase [Candidatus Acidoferrum sp.]|nr:metallophosphoesterase [Candidatus Acidoferrum sp.]